MFAMDIRILWKLNFKEEIYFPLLLAYFFFMKRHSLIIVQISQRKNK